MSADLIWPRAQVFGLQLFNLGAFPGAVPSSPEKRIIGEVYKINENILAQVDIYEGYRPDNPESSLYCRRTVEAQNIENKSFLSSYVYILNERRLIARNNYQLIENGDWLSLKDDKAKEKINEI